MTYSLPVSLGDLAPLLTRGSNLAFALRLLPSTQRRDMGIFYAFCRLVDDIADHPSLSIETKQQGLDLWKNAFASPSLLPEDLAELMQRHALDSHYFLELIKGVESDLYTARYETFEALQTYCWRVASTVGLVSIKIFGCTHAKAAAYAESAGMALQLTNILRDVREDVMRNRIYLPLEELSAFSVTEEELLCQKPGSGFLPLMAHMGERAREYFEKTHHLLPDAERNKLPASELMQQYYSRILEKMTRGKFRVFQHRYHLSFTEKLCLAVPYVVKSSICRR